MIRWLLRRIRLAQARGRLADIDRVEREAKNTIAQSWIERDAVVREIEELQ